MPVYESNGVRRQDKEHVICKLCDAALKYTVQETQQTCKNTSIGTIQLYLRIKNR